MLGKSDFLVRLTKALVTLICSSLALSLCGCERFGCDGDGRSGRGVGETVGAPEWTFDGSRIVAGDDGAPLTGPIYSMAWAAVVDADARQVARLQVPDTEESRLTEVDPGRRWTCKGFILGPGEEASEVLRENRLIRYDCEIVVDDERSLTLNFNAEVLQHVVLASFSYFEIRLPLAGYTGARATVDGSFGGVILDEVPGGPCHPSYWEGPMSSLEIKGDRVTLGLDVDKAGFTWVSFLDGRALQSPEPSLIIQLNPAIAGPRERLGSLAAKGSVHSTSIRFTVDPPAAKPDAEPDVRELQRVEAPARLPDAVSTAILEGGWELAPFTEAPGSSRGFTPSLGHTAHWSELPVSGRLERSSLTVEGRGRPVTSFVLASGPVENLRLKINGRGDCLDGNEIMEELSLPPGRGRRTAEEVWRYAARTTYSMPLHPTDDLGEFIGSYGYGFSSTLSAMALVRLWGHAGLPARRTFLSGRTGYAIAEAFYDGDWHAFDLADRVYYLDPVDMSLASAEELASRPELVRLNSDASGMGPGGVPAEETAREIYENADLSYNVGGIGFERLMRISLAKGEQLVRFFRPLGRWAPSPREPYNYANALLAFTPDTDDPNALDGFLATQNVTLREGTLVPKDPTEPAWIEYSAVSPYVIVEAQLKIEADREAFEAISTLLSLDQGTTWIPVDFDPVSGTADLTPHLVPGPQEAGTAYERLDRNFSYQLHIELAASDGEATYALRSLSVLTWTQMNPALLPRLRAGVNSLETRCSSYGPGASVTLGWIEGDLRTEPEEIFVGEPFTLRGAIAYPEGGISETTVVKAYALTPGGRVELGSWGPESAQATDIRLPFELSCRPIDLAVYYPQIPVGAVRLEIAAGPTADPPSGWESTFETDVRLRLRPDLVVLPDLVDLSPAPPSTGEEVQITALVRNFCPGRELLYFQGTPSPPADVALYEIEGDSRRLVQTVTLPEIAPGSAAPAVFRWTAPSAAGSKALVIVADPEDEVRERDEANSAVVRLLVTPNPR